MKYKRSSAGELFTAMNPGGEATSWESRLPAGGHESETESGGSAILGCLYEWNLEMLETLLAAEPELNIFEASALGRVDRVRELVACEPKLACSWSLDGLTPLHLACFYGQEEVTAYLLKAGADPSVRARNESRTTPLHEAASTGQLGITITLLTYGAKVDDVDCRGWTALHSAAWKGNLEIVEALLQFGAAPCRNDEGQTPRDLALMNDRVQTLQLLDSPWVGYQELWPPLTVCGRSH